MVHYEMYKRDATNKCADCGKQNREVSNQEWVIDYRNSPVWKPGDTAREYLCLNCGDKINQHNIDEENEKIRKRIKKRKIEIQTILRESATNLTQINQKEINSLTIEDYQALTSFQNKIKKIDELDKKWLEDELSAQASFILTDIDYQLENLKKAKEFFPEKIKARANWQNKKGGGYKNRIRIPTKKCSHTNIVYEEDKPYDWFCQECGEDASLSFLKSLQENLVFDIKENYCQKHNLSLKELNDLSLLNSYNRLKFNNYSNQQEIREDFQKTEKDLQALLKSKGIDKEQRERERAKIQSAITNLENKSDKTPEEEEELDELKGKLKDLDRKQESPSNSYLPWIVGGGCLVAVLVLIAFIATRKRKKGT